MTLTEVEKVFEQLRLEKAIQRTQLMEFRKTEPRLILSNEQKIKLIANIKNATQADKEDAALWSELRTQHTIPTSPLFRKS